MPTLKRNAVVKGLEFRPHRMRPRDSVAHTDHGMYTVSSKHAVNYVPHDMSPPKKLGTHGSRTEAIAAANEHHGSMSKAGEAYLPRPKTEFATPREGMSRMNYGVRSKKDTTARRRAGIRPLGTHTVSAKGLMTLDAYYDMAVKGNDAVGRAAYMATAAKLRGPDPKRTASVDRPPPGTPDVATRPKKFPRKLKPTVQMKPISDEEAAKLIGAGHSAKSIRWLSAIKALATGYGKTSGGGALKASNRGASRLQLLGPNGRPGKGSRSRRKLRSGKPNFGTDGRHGPRSDRASFGLKRRLRRAMEAMSSPMGDAESNRDADGATRGDTEYHQTNDRGITKGTTVPKTPTNFNDIFKAELGPADGDVLADCPHCEAPITKSDLAKGRGKGKATDISGGKRGKSGASVRDQNPEGGTTRGGDGRGVITPSRGVPGAQKTDAAVGVQNGKGSNARKGGADSSVEEGEDDAAEQAAAEPDVAKSGASKKPTVTIRGTEFVQYVDDGSDARLAKAIAEGGFGGTQPTQPLDLNNDLARLLY